jgi:hypothetical protein
MGLAMSPQGLCFAEAGNHRVRLLCKDGTLTTIAGNGRWGFSGDCRDARLAELVHPTGLCAKWSSILRGELGGEPRDLVLYVVDGNQIKVLGDERVASQ